MIQADVWVAGERLRFQADKSRGDLRPTDHVAGTRPTKNRRNATRRATSDNERLGLLVTAVADRV
jgi:hypothetical protein